MANENTIRFTLDDATQVAVKKAKNNTYDFELLLTNKSRKTFLWSNEFIISADRKGNFDAKISEAIKKFIDIIKLNYSIGK